MKKLFVADFDGTLIDDEEAIPMTTVLAIDKFRNLGNSFVIATGRIPTSVLSYNQDFNFLDYVIACNGAYIYDVAREKAMVKKPLSREIIREIKQSFEGCCLIYFCTPQNWHLYISTIYQEKNDKVMKSDIKDFNRFLSKYKKHIYKIELHFKNLEEAKKALKEIARQKLAINFNLQVFEKSTYLIEITAKGVDKFEAVRSLVQIEKVKLKDVVAVGDSYNDIKMIKKVGYGVAVSNACEEAKKVAKEITLSNNERGVEKVLEKICELH